jgi:hypothetical protein
VTSLVKEIDMPPEVQMALGRIFKLMSRPYQEGDIEQYEAARRVVLAYSEEPIVGWVPDYSRDRLRGAQGE